MAFREAQFTQAPCTKRNADWWWGWIREQPEWVEELSWLRWRGEAPRSIGLPLREIGAHEVEKLGGDHDRAVRYASRARRLGKVLPPQLRPLLALAIPDYRGVLEVEIRGSRSLLSADDASRLQDVAARTLRREPLSRADRSWRDRALCRIDPTHVVILGPTNELDPGSALSICPTSLAVGSVALGASQSGWLPAGYSMQSFNGRMGFRPVYSYTAEL